MCVVYMTRIWLKPRAPTPLSLFSSTQDFPECDDDRFKGFKTIRDIYEHSDSAQKKFSVPVLWDTKTGGGNTISSLGSFLSHPTPLLVDYSLILRA